MDIQYLNEHLLPGKLGHLLLILSFVTSLLASFAYLRSKRALSDELSTSWKHVGRAAFSVHGISLIGVVGIIFYVMLNQYYEYNYVWAHVSEDLDFRYIFSAFWEGQEGSFMLWMFWHIVLGWILMFNAGKWEAPVMSILSFVQFFIGSMLVGLYFYVGDEFIKIGSNPLLLLRDVQEAPIFLRPDYTDLINGNGLSPLLQNYWMTIHPPTLFLGFASTVVPFCFAVAGLWTSDHKGWMAPALRWALFSGAILGTGILMGGAWAYEALSFGGYWAWDPVENMSLVPWLVLVSGIHMNVVAKNTGYYIKSAYLFYILTFVLILYSTFLTRSGILGETSVHAFTEMGLEWQLVIFIMTFLIPPLVLFFRKRKEIPTIEREETAYSKEFWMFIGSLVLIFSGVLITFTTSIPVYNAILLGAGDILGVDWSGNLLQQPVDVEAHHNKFQLWIGVFIAFLSGMAQFLRYNEEIWSTSRRNKFLKHVGISLGLALAIGIGVCMMADILTWQYVTLMVSGFFVIFTNVDYVITVLRGKIKVSGSAVSHIGFGILLIGVLFSGVKKQVISRGFMGVDLIEGFNDEDRTQNILLRKGLATDMGEYKVTYIGDEMDGFTRRFNLEFERMDESGENVLESFDLQPNILYNRELSKVEASNPSTKHYFHKDIFTHISALPNSEVNGEEVEPKQDTLDYTDHEISLGDTIYTSKHYVIFKEYNGLPKHEEYEAQEGDLAVGAKLEIRTLNTDSTWFAEPIYLIRNKFVMPIKDEVKELGLHFKFQKIDPDTKTVIIGVAETAPRWDYVVLQAIVFPGINLVWLGSIMMMIGLAMSMWFRRQSRRA